MGGGRCWGGRSRRLRGRGPRVWGVSSLEEKGKEKKKKKGGKKGKKKKKGKEKGIEEVIAGLLEED